MVVNKTGKKRSVRTFDRVFATSAHLGVPAILQTYLSWSGFLYRTTGKRYHCLNYSGDYKIKGQISFRSLGTGISF